MATQPAQLVFFSLASLPPAKKDGRNEAGQNKQETVLRPGRSDRCVKADGFFLVCISLDYTYNGDAVSLDSGGGADCSSLRWAKQDGHLSVAIRLAAAGGAVRLLRNGVRGKQQ